MDEKEPKKIGRPRTRPEKPGLLERELGPEHADVIAEYKASREEERSTAPKPEERVICLPSGRSRGKIEAQKKATENSPIASGHKKVGKEDSGEAIDKMIELYNLPAIDTGNPVELAERVAWFFNWCKDGGIRPGVEALALACGVTRGTINRWEHGENGPDRRDIIKKAKQLIASYNEFLALKGKINPVTFIFLSKNNHGYVDKTEVNITTDSALGDRMSADDIAQRLPDADVIDADFREITPSAGGELSDNNE
jgi:transcriptional regulator with XRE-family HTH domain